MSQATLLDIYTTLEKLPPDKLNLVTEFLSLLEKASLNDAHFPTPEKFLVTHPAHDLQNWRRLLTYGYDGDALADSEAVYDDV